MVVDNNRLSGWCETAGAWFADCYFGVSILTANLSKLFDVLKCSYFGLNIQNQHLTVVKRLIRVYWQSCSMLFKQEKFWLKGVWLEKFGAFI